MHEDKHLERLRKRRDNLQDRILASVNALATYRLLNLRKDERKVTTELVSLSRKLKQAESRYYSALLSTD